MDNSLRASIETLIKSRRGFEFEAFIKELHLIRYGSDGFNPTRERGDQGSDGVILDSRTIVASYGPDNYKEQAFENKSDEDFDSYLNNWATDYPNWILFYNGSLAPEQIKKVNDRLLATSKKRKIKVKALKVKGIDQIIRFIEDDLNNRQQRALAHWLGVAKELVIIDHVRSIIDDLIRGVGMVSENMEYKLQINIEEKIALNFSEQDRQEAIVEYQDLVMTGNLKKIWSILSTYEPEEINSLKYRIRRDFNGRKGNFKKKLNELTVTYSEKYASDQDDDFNYYTRSLLIYCFEQCMIGEKTEKEKEFKTK
jgi:hypothetical protein